MAASLVPGPLSARSRHFTALPLGQRTSLAPRRARKALDGVTSGAALFAVGDCFLGLSGRELMEKLMES